MTSKRGQHHGRINLSLKVNDDGDDDAVENSFHDRFILIRFVIEQDTLGVNATAAESDWHEPIMTRRITTRSWSSHLVSWLQVAPHRLLHFMANRDRVTTVNHDTADLNTKSITALGQS